MKKTHTRYRRYDLVVCIRSLTDCIIQFTTAFYSFATIYPVSQCMTLYIHRIVQAI